MLSIAVPESIKPLLVSHLPEALIIGCPETNSGAISHLQLPAEITLDSFTVIACGPGLTTEVTPVVEQVMKSEVPLILDADALNILAQLGTITTLKNRHQPTILTPHGGEFHRLFPEIDITTNRVKGVQTAASQTGAIVLLKGARTAIANEQGVTWINSESTPALARGGSGDVLTGLMGGILGQVVNRQVNMEDIVATAVWWHSQAGILAAKERTELGVDAFTLTQYLSRVLAQTQTDEICMG